MKRHILLPFLLLGAGLLELLKLTAEILPGEHTSLRSSVRITKCEQGSLLRIRCIATSINEKHPYETEGVFCF